MRVQRSSDKWIEPILLVESFKLVPRTLDEGPRQKSGKLRLIWHLLWRENQNCSDQKTVLKGELLIWRTKNQSRGPRYTPSQGFNLLHMSPNWVLGNWTLDPSSQVGLMVFHCKTPFDSLWGEPQSAKCKVLDIWCKVQTCLIQHPRP